ncbi:MAG: hypothetical protein ABUL77_02835 [Bacteroidota bacterium]
MTFSLVPLLLHASDVPATARRALQLATDGPLDERRQHLTSAARILHRELDLDCGDARELVGLVAQDEAVAA